MNNEPIKFNVSALDGIGREYIFKSTQDLKESIETRERLGKDSSVYVDIEDFERLKAAMVEKLREEGMTYAALFVIKQLGLEEAVGLAPISITLGYQRVAADTVDDIASPDIGKTTSDKIGMFADNPVPLAPPRPVMGSKPDKPKTRKKAK